MSNIFGETFEKTVGCRMGNRAFDLYDSLKIKHLKMENAGNGSLAHNLAYYAGTISALSVVGLSALEGVVETYARETFDMIKKPKAAHVSG